jgi:hypothetical protein
MALKIKKDFIFTKMLTFLRKFVFIHYNSKHLHYFSAIALMMEAAGTSETSVNNYFTWQYIPEGKSECAKNVHLIQTQFVLNGTI